MILKFFDIFLKMKDLTSSDSFLVCGMLFLFYCKLKSATAEHANQTASVKADIFMSKLLCTVMILSFRTDRFGQTVQTQIRLLLEEQSDQGLHCLLFHLHLFSEIP